MPRVYPTPLYYGTLLIMITKYTAFQVLELLIKFRKQGEAIGTGNTLPAISRAAEPMSSASRSNPSELDPVL
jgi:hypothetical protein